MASEAQAIPDQTHIPCPCGESTDAYTMYEDGHGWCYGQCGGKYFNNKGIQVDTPNKDTDAKPNFYTGDYQELKNRNLKQKTCEKYGVRVNTTNGGAYIFEYQDGKGGPVVAQKIKNLKDKSYRWVGHKNAIGLFGQWLFPAASAKMITLTEGEFDAMASYEMMGSKYPCVSISGGAAAAERVCKDHYKYLDSFDKIVVNFDNDPPGKEAADKIVKLFTGKVKVLQLKEHKDANEYLKAFKSEAYSNEWWRAELIKPSNIVSGESLWEYLKKDESLPSVDMPWEGLNKLSFGARLNEFWVFTGGTGLGKSLVLRELIYHFLQTTKYNIGAIFLEEIISTTVKGIMSIEAEKPLHLPTTEITSKEKREIFERTFGTNRIFLCDEFGSNSIDNILNIMKYYVKACDCKILLLDHISMMVSDQQSGDERKTLDEIATKLKTFCKANEVILFAVIHLKRADGRPFEEGRKVTLGDLRGTAGIGQLSDFVIAGERNGQAEDMIERNTTLIRVLKNRFTGLTGPACKLLYTLETSRLNELIIEDEVEEEVEDDTKEI
jgi:twinkle protein